MRHEISLRLQVNDETLAKLRESENSHREIRLIVGGSQPTVHHFDIEPPAVAVVTWSPSSNEYFLRYDNVDGERQLEAVIGGEDVTNRLAFEIIGLIDVFEEYVADRASMLDGTAFAPESRTLDS